MKAWIDPGYIHVTIELEGVDHDHLLDIIRALKCKVRLPPHAFQDPGLGSWASKLRDAGILAELDT